MVADAYGTVEDDDALQRGAEGADAVGLVILLLFSDEEEAHLRVVDHKLYLLFAAGGVERYRHRADAPCAEIREEILDAVLREHAHVLLWPYAEVEQRVRHDLDRSGEAVPRIRFPL